MDAIAWEPARSPRIFKPAPTAITADEARLTRFIASIETLGGGAEPRPRS